MGYWLDRDGVVTWVEGDVDMNTYVNTGRTRWWSSWAPSCFNAELPIYALPSRWTDEQLLAVITRIRDEIHEFDDRWDVVERSLADDGLSTCQAKSGDGAKHQSLRRYNIVVNRTNPLNYDIGLSRETLIAIGTVHEKTHALCDLSYTANNKASRLATWNDDNGAFSEGSDAAAATKRRMERLWELLDADDMRPDWKKTMQDRVVYGAANLIDIDTVVNELCLVASRISVSKSSRAIAYLIRLAVRNLTERANGRRAQLDVVALRV